jgi:hypothetical protein
MNDSLQNRLAARHGEELLKLARSVFGDEISDVETALFERLGVLDCRTLSGYSENSLPELRADRVAWLLVDPEARGLLTPQGVQISFATIQGILDISFCQVNLSLALAHCRLDQGLTLHDAKLAMLYLSDSHCGPIFADRIKVKGDVFLKGATAKGEIRLLGADVGGNLDCSGATFENPDGPALSADGIKVNGNLFLNDEFTAKGQVRLLNATVDGDLNCSDSTLDDPNGYALHADGFKTMGSIYLQNTTAKGEVRLLGAEVGGILDCNGAILHNIKKYTLNADRIKVKGSIFLGEKFTATGEVRLPSANVGGDVSFLDTRLHNPSGRTLTADGIKVKGNFLLWGISEIQGKLAFTNATIDGRFDILGLTAAKQIKLHLSGAHVGVLWDEKKSWPGPGQLYLDNFSYDRIDKDAPWDVKDRLEWLKLQPKGKFSSQPYEQLAKVYREAGREEEALEILYAKNAHRAECIYKGIVPASLFSKIWIEFTWLVFGYGCRPKQALLSFAFLVFFGSLAYLAFGAEKLVSSTRTNLALDGKHLTEFNPFYYSLDAAIPLVELGQTAAWTMSGWLAQGYNAFHTVAGWVIVLLLVGALTGLIKK